MKFDVAIYSIKHFDLVAATRLTYEGDPARFTLLDARNILNEAKKEYRLSAKAFILIVVGRPIMYYLTQQEDGYKVYPLNEEIEENG